MSTPAERKRKRFLSLNPSWQSSSAGVLVSRASGSPALSVVLLAREERLRLVVLKGSLVKPPVAVRRSLTKSDVANQQDSATSHSEFCTSGKP